MTAVLHFASPHSMVTWRKHDSRCRVSCLLSVVHVDDTLPLSEPHFCSGEPQLSLVKRPQGTWAGGSLRRAVQVPGWAPFHWRVRCRGPCGVQAWIIKLWSDVHGQGVHCRIIGHFCCDVSTTVLVAVGGQSVNVTDPQLRVTPTFHLDIQDMLLLWYRISHPISHHFSESSSSRVMKDQSPAPPQKPTSSTSSLSLLPGSPGDTNVAVWVIRIFRAPIVRVQKLQSQCS